MESRKACQLLAQYSRVQQEMPFFLKNRAHPVTLFFEFIGNLIMENFVSSVKCTQVFVMILEVFLFFIFFGFYILASQEKSTFI